MKSTDSEQEGVGMELEQYRNRLEQMVEEKSKDLIAIQENLEATNRRQALFIKVLQILQLEPDIPTAMNMALAEIGRYTGVDRLATWENHLDGPTGQLGHVLQYSSHHSVWQNAFRIHLRSGWHARLPVCHLFLKPVQWFGHHIARNVEAHNRDVPGG